MSYLDGKNPSISVGEKGILRVATYLDLTGATGLQIKVYDAETFDGDDVNPAPLSTLTAREVSDTPGAPLWEIEADNPGTLFAAEGEYVIRASILWGLDGVLGTPVRFFVTRGSA